MTARMADGVEMPLSNGPWPGAYPRPELAWLPDGKGLAAIILDGDTGRRQIYEFGYPSGAVKRITNDLTSYFNLALTGDSTSLVTIKDDTAYQIWILDPSQPDAMRQVTSSSSGYRDPAWMPNGMLLAAGNGLWWIDPASARKHQVPGTTASDEKPVSTTDGKSVFFTSRRNNEIAVWRVGLDGRGLAQVTHGDNGSLPRISPDGRWLVYSGFAGDGIAIWRIPAEGGLPARVSWGLPARDPDISPDNKWVAARVPGGPRRLAIYPFEGGQPVKVFPVPGLTLDRVAWSADGAALTYIGHRGGVSNIWRQPVDGSEPTQMTHFETQRIADFAWSPDGRLAVARAERAADVVVIRGFRE